MIPLSPVDQVFTAVGAYPIEFVFAYGGRPDPDRLRESLLAAVERYAVVLPAEDGLDGRICLPQSTRDGGSTGGACPPAQRAPVPPSSPA